MKQDKKLINQIFLKTWQVELVVYFIQHLTKLICFSMYMISVIIIVFNRTETLLTCLPSLNHTQQTTYKHRVTLHTLTINTQYINNTYLYDNITQQRMNCKYI